MERDDIIQRLLAKVATYKTGTGVWYPEKAEAVAKRLGLDLKPKPDASEFMKEPFWTFIQAIGWIAWRTAETVREHADRYRQGSLDWLPTAEGDVLGSLAPTRSTYFNLELMEAAGLRDGNPPLVPVERARMLLWEALQAAELVANAIDRATDKRREIAALDFLELELETDTEHGMGTVVTLRKHPQWHPYHNPKLKSADVLRLWPAPEPARRAQTSHLMAVEKLRPTPQLPNARGASRRAMEQAVKQLWQSSMPETMQAKERDAQIKAYVKRVTRRDISDRTIQRFLKAMRAGG